MEVKELEERLCFFKRRKYLQKLKIWSAVMQSKDRDGTTGTAEEMETGYSLKRQDDTEEMESSLQFEEKGRTQQLKRGRAAYSLKRRDDCSS